ncbi:MAG: ribonuclease III [Prevotella sp.]|nr:ribonuclease III [Prevotella sp.]
MSKIIDQIRLPFRKEKELYLSLYRILGFYPRHIEFYKQALLHKSSAKRTEKGKPINNERMEFLGDAVLGSVVGDIVYQHFPGKREGFLTNTRSKIVQRETLNRLAADMGINKLLVSNGRASSHNNYLGGNAFEALVGAIYLDRGYDMCRQFVKKKILKQLINIDKVAYKEVNFKSKLLEWTQKNRVVIAYHLISETKDEKNSPIFTYQVLLEGVEGATGTGYSKKESQQIASRETLNMLKNQPEFIDAIFASKSNRTKMEEEPMSAVPKFENETVEQQKTTTNTKKESQQPEKTPPQTEEEDAFDLSDITAREPSREDIIAAAEEAAFSQQG